jgi:predicted nucleic acid-binding protein
VLLAEPDAASIRRVLAEGDAWHSSELLIVELRRLAMREGLEESAERMLDAVRLMSVDPVSLERASRIAPTGVRSLDAIHLDAIVQYMVTATLTGY